MKVEAGVRLGDFSPPYVCDLMGDLEISVSSIYIWSKTSRPKSEAKNGGI